MLVFISLQNRFQIHIQELPWVHSMWWKHVASKLQPPVHKGRFYLQIHCVHSTYVVIADTTQRWWIFYSANEHRDELYRELTLYSGFVLSIILEHGKNFNSYNFGLFLSYVFKYNTLCFTNTFSPCLQACFSQNNYHRIIIYTVIKCRLKSNY